MDHKITVENYVYLLCYKIEVPVLSQQFSNLCVVVKFWEFQHHSLPPKYKSSSTPLGSFSETSRIPNYVIDNSRRREKEWEAITRMVAMLVGTMYYMYIYIYICVCVHVNYNEVSGEASRHQSSSLTISRPRRRATTLFEKGKRRGRFIRS